MGHTWNQWVAAWQVEHGGSFKDALRDAAPSWHAMRRGQAALHSPRKAHRKPRTSAAKSARTSARKSAGRKSARRVTPSKKAPLRGGDSTKPSTTSSSALRRDCGMFPRVKLQGALREGRDLTMGNVTLPIAKLPKAKRDALVATLTNGVDNGRPFRVFVTSVGDINVVNC